MMQTRWAYLVHLLAWSLPILLLQLALLARVYRRDLPRVLRAILPPALGTTVWLVLADHLAISQGIWHFGQGRHLGVYLLGVPLEELLFFLITNLLVAFGLTLFREMGALPRRASR